VNLDCLGGVVTQDSQDDEESGLSPGVIAGIVIGSLFGFIIMPVLLFFGIKVYRKSAKLELIPDTARDG